LREHFAEFERCYGKDPYGRSKRKPEDSKENRWRSFTIDEAKARETFEWFWELTDTLRHVRDFAHARLVGY